MAKSETARVAAQIKKELKNKYPKLKFSVTSSIYSGGDSVYVSWNFGPRRDEIKLIAEKYQEGYFDGMEDIYKNTGGQNIVNKEGELEEIGVKFVSESRTYEMPGKDYSERGRIYEELAKALAELHGAEWKGSASNTFLFGSDNRHNAADQEAFRVLGNSEFETNKVTSFDGIEEIPKGFKYDDVEYDGVDFLLNGESLGQLDTAERIIIIYNGGQKTIPRSLYESLESAKASRLRLKEEAAVKEKEKEKLKLDINQLKSIVNNHSLSDAVRQIAQSKIYDLDYKEVDEDIKKIEFKRFKMLELTFINVNWPLWNKNSTLEEYKERLAIDLKDNKKIEQKTKILQVLIMNTANFEVVSRCLMCNLPDLWKTIGGSEWNTEDLKKDLKYSEEDWTDFSKRMKFFNITEVEKEVYFKHAYTLGTLVYNEDTQEAFAVNTEGYDYARYAGFPTSPAQTEKALLNIQVSKEPTKRTKILKFIGNKPYNKFFEEIEIKSVSPSVRKRIKALLEDEDYKIGIVTTEANKLAKVIMNKYPKLVGIEEIDEAEDIKETEEKIKKVKETKTKNKKVMELRKRLKVVQKMAEAATGKESRKKLEIRAKLIEDMISEEEKNSPKMEKGGILDSDPNYRYHAKQYLDNKFSDVAKKIKYVGNDTYGVILDKGATIDDVSIATAALENDNIVIENFELEPLFDLTAARKKDDDGHEMFLVKLNTKDYKGPKKKTGGKVKGEYYIFHGYDHFTDKPLYKVSGRTNEYVGEWHTKLEDAEKELEALITKKRKGGKITKADKIAKVMGEFKAGTLKSSSGEKVTNKKQAIAIAMSEAGASKKEKGGRVWTDKEESKVKSLNAEFQKELAKKELDSYSKDAADFWKSGGYRDRMRGIFGKAPLDKKENGGETGSLRSTWDNKEDRFIYDTRIELLKQVGFTTSKGLPDSSAKKSAKLSFDELPLEVKHPLIEMFKKGVLKLSKGGELYTMTDGYQFRKVSEEYAKKNWDKEEIYGLSGNTEALIESKEDIDRFEDFGKELKKKGGKLIILSSVGTAYDPKTEFAYPINQDGTPDLEAGVHMDAVSEEWMESLSDGDRKKLQNAPKLKKGGKVTKKDDDWFQQAIDKNPPDTLGGWKSSLKAEKRRSLAFQSRSKKERMSERYLSAARALQALVNVTQDKDTKIKAKRDADWFMAKYHARIKTDGKRLKKKN